MMQFLQRCQQQEEEKEEGDEDMVIIAHGGYLCDFPILLANLIKYGVDYSVLKHCKFVDSMKLIKEVGVQRPGLDSLRIRTSGDMQRHSALNDARLLMKICHQFGDVMSSSSVLHSDLSDVLHFLQKKLPISISDLHIRA